MNDFYYPQESKNSFKKGDILANEIIVDVWTDVNGKVQYSSKKLSRFRIVKNI